MLGKRQHLKNMQKTVILDANAILRYITDDIKEQADVVEEVLLSRDVLILPEVLAEVVYVMTKYYKYPKEKAAKYISKFLEDADCNNTVFNNALDNFGKTSMDFVDCLLYGYSKETKYEVFTFDKDLIKLLDKG